jgi:rubrerythrin
MRSSLLHPLTERPPRRHRPKRQTEHRVGRLPALAHKREAKLAISAPEETELAIAAHQPLDIVVERVRAAGGPLDQASYICECGYLFAAPVSTTVSCPHCGTPQAW